MTERKKQRKHMSGGTLRIVMSEEIKRALSKFSKLDVFQQRMAAAAELGITWRTIMKWLGPVEKGGWEELQGNGGMAKLVGTKVTSTKKKHTTKKTKKHGRSTTTTTNSARAA